MQRQVEHGVQRVQQTGIEIESLRVEDPVPDDAAPGGVRAIRYATAFVVQVRRREPPAIRRHLRGRRAPGGDEVPEGVQVMGSGEHAPESDDSDGSR